MPASYEFYRTVGLEWFVHALLIADGLYLLCDGRQGRIPRWLFDTLSGLLCRSSFLCRSGLNGSLFLGSGLSSLGCGGLGGGSISGGLLGRGGLYGSLLGSGGLRCLSSSFGHSYLLYLVRAKDSKKKFNCLIKNEIIPKPGNCSREIVKNRQKKRKSLKFKK